MRAGTADDAAGDGAGISVGEAACSASVSISMAHSVNGQPAHVNASLTAGRYGHRVNLFRIFRSRRAALLWAGSVIWFAYDVASANTPEEPASIDATGVAVNAADLAILANAAGS